MAFAPLLRENGKPDRALNYKCFREWFQVYGNLSQPQHILGTIQPEPIFFAADNYPIALDARTAKPILEFGENGKLNLNIGVPDNPEDIALWTS